MIQDALSLEFPNSNSFYEFCKEDPMLWEKVIKELLSRKADNVSVTNILNRTEGFQYSDIFIHNNDYVQKYIDENAGLLSKECRKNI